MKRGTEIKNWRSKFLNVLRQDTSLTFLMNEILLGFFFLTDFFRGEICFFQPEKRIMMLKKITKKLKLLTHDSMLQ